MQRSGKIPLSSLSRFYKCLPFSAFLFWEWIRSIFYRSQESYMAFLPLFHFSIHFRPPEFCGSKKPLVIPEGSNGKVSDSFSLRPSFATNILSSVNNNPHSVVRYCCGAVVLSPLLIVCLTLSSSAKLADWAIIVFKSIIKSNMEVSIFSMVPSLVSSTFQITWLI